MVRVSLLPTMALALALLLPACSGPATEQATTPAVFTTNASVRAIDWAAVAHPHLDLSADDELGAPQYFDLTRDGVDDAALEGLAITPGGNSYSTYVFVYTLASGASEPTLIATLVGGDRADGAIRLTAVDAAGLHLARAIQGPEDALCCPSTEQHELWVWNGSEFVEDPTARRVAPTEE